jgi:hypothetical protein
MPLINFLFKGKTMKVTQVVEAGEVKSVYLWPWSLQVELGVDGGELKFKLTESTLKNLHRRFGEALTELAESRLADAKALVDAE